jgi:PAS domain S-box-containing protein
LGPLDEVTRHIKIRVYMALAGVFLAVIVVSTAVLGFQYVRILEAEQRRAENLASILADHFTRSVGGIEATLRALALHSQHMAPPKAGDQGWQSLIETGLAGLPGARAILILDEDGTITHATIPGAVGRERRSMPIYQQLRNTPQNGVVADSNYRSLIDGAALIAFAHRLISPDGRFVGVAVAAMEPGQLRNFYRSVEKGEHGIIWVLHPQGETLFREMSDAEARNATPSPILAAQQRAPNGSIRAALPGGADTYVTGYRTLNRPSLVIAVSFAERELLGGWRNLALAQTLTLALIGVAIAMAGMFIGREVQARSAAEARFHAVLDHAPLLFSVKDRRGHFTFVNRAFERTFQLELDEAVGKRAQDFMAEAAAEQVQAMDRRVFATGRPVQNEIGTPDPDRKGAQRRHLLIKFPLFNARGQVEAIGTVAADVTEQHALKEQLVHAGKMEALGQLTSGIAHDFNNLLTTILLNAGILCSQVGNQQLLSLAREINFAAERASQLTRRLLTFGRRQWLDPQPTDVGELVEAMADLMRRTLGSKIEIEITHGGDGPHRALVDPGQLENALLNLAVNARDAMPDGGRLSIGIGPRADGADDNAFVAISVADTGLGMAADVLARACEPFFTTKGAGKGTGLGLSMAYGFLQQSGGRLEIQSEPGAGTTVLLLLPRAQDAADTGTEAGTAGESVVTDRRRDMFRRQARAGR